MKTIYVKAGAINGSGTMQNPFGTLTEARDALRAMPQTDGAEVLLYEGRYSINETVTFTAQDSGTAEHPVTYRAKDGAQVIFDGGVVVPNEKVKPLLTAEPETAKRLIDRDAAKNAYVIDLSGLDIQYGTYGTRGFRRPYVPAPNELFISGAPMTVARYPKKENGSIPLTDVIDKGSTPRTGDFSLRPFTIRYDNECTEKWASAKEAYLSGFFCESFADDTVGIGKIEPKDRTITTTLPHLYGAVAKSFCRWCIVNLLEELSAPEEYYIDTQAQKVYFIPPKGVDVNTALMQISSLDRPVFSFFDASHIIFDGLTVENSRGTGIYIEGGDGIQIRSCILHNLGMLGIQIGKGASAMPEGRHTYHGEREAGIEPPHPISEEMGSWHEYIYEFPSWNNNGGCNHLIESCDIFDTGTGGMLLSGGNRKKLIPANNTVNNCVFTRTNRLDKTYKAAVNLMGVGNRVTHNEMYDLSGNAIYFYGNDHYIAYNKIHEVLQEVSDSGAIYSARDMSHVGNVIEKNFIYHIHNKHKDGLGLAAIYLDDYMIYNRIYGNYFYDIVSDGSFFFSTIYYTCGGLTSIANNIFIDCLPGLDPNVHGNAYYYMHESDEVKLKISTKDDDDMHGVDITSPLWHERYPYLYETYVNNFHPGNCYYNNQVYYHNYGFFRDAEHLDFRFRDDAFMYNEPHEDFLVHDVVMGIDGKMVPMERDLEFEKIGVHRT